MNLHTDKGGILPSREEEKAALEPMVGAAEAAKALGVNIRTLKRMADRGEIPGMQIGNRWRFLLSVLDAWRKQKLMARCSKSTKEDVA